MPGSARAGDHLVCAGAEAASTNGATHYDRSPKRNPGIKAHLCGNVKNYLTSIPILCCCFCSGLIDASVFNAWQVFATMQTGNTIILGLGASRQPPGHIRDWTQALMAIVFFFLGSFFCSRTTGALGPLRHLTLALSFVLQCALIITAAALVQGGVVPGIVGDERLGSQSLLTLIPLPMLSFQAGMQSVTARQLGINEVPTTVLTSVYCDLGNDPDLFVPFTKNWKRNRRVGAVICIVVGAIIGGWLGKTSGGMAVALWVAAGVKSCLAVAWLLWRSDEGEHET